MLSVWVNRRKAGRRDRVDEPVPLDERTIADEDADRLIGVPNQRGLPSSLRRRQADASGIDEVVDLARPEPDDQGRIVERRASRSRMSSGRASPRSTNRSPTSSSAGRAKSHGQTRWRLHTAPARTPATSRHRWGSAANSNRAAATNTITASSAIAATTTSSGAPLTGHGHHDPPAGDGDKQHRDDDCCSIVVPHGDAARSGREQCRRATFQPIAQPCRRVNHQRHHQRPTMDVLRVRQQPTRSLGPGRTKADGKPSEPGRDQQDANAPPPSSPADDNPGGDQRPPGQHVRDPATRLRLVRQPFGTPPTRTAATTTIATTIARPRSLTGSRRPLPITRRAHPLGHSGTADHRPSEENTVPRAHMTAVDQ